MHPVSIETLREEIARLEAIEFVCRQYGESVGQDAAQSQLRALKACLASRESD